MKTITITEAQNRVLRDYIELQTLEARTSFSSDYDDFNSEDINKAVLSAVNEMLSYMQSIFTEEQFEAITDAEQICDDYEDLTQIDYNTYLNYIDIIVE